MILADWIFIFGALVVALVGWLVGFGKTLKFFTSGIFGILISVFVCYCLGGLILNIGFVQDLVAKLGEIWNTKDGFFFEFLTKIRLEVIIYYIVLFIIVQLLRILTVNLLKRIVESDKAVLKAINKILGAVLLVAMGLLIVLFIFQIILWVGGDTLQSVKEGLFGSALKLDYILLDGNPLAQIVEYIKNLLFT